MLRRPGWSGWVMQQDVVVTDHLEPRVRVPADLLRCLLSVAEIAALAGIALLAGATATGLDIDIVGASHRLPAGLLRLIGYAGSLVLLTLPVALAVRLLRRLTEALITGGITAGGVAVIDLLLSSPSRLHAALHTPAPGPTFDGYLAAVVAYVTVIGLRGHAHWRPAFLTGIAFYGLTSLASGHATVVSVLITVLIGSATGSGLRYAFGAISGRPTAAEIAAALSTDGAPITTIRRLGNGASETRRYEARTAAGRRLDVTVFDRDQQAADAFYRLYRRLRVSAHISRSAPLSLEGAVERQALMIWATRDAGVLTPKLRAVTRVADSGAATTDDELRRVWDAVLRLHEHRVTHRALTADRILITRRGEVVLLDPGNGDVAASDLQTRLDLVQLIAQTALLVGADRAADVAIEKAGRVELLVPLLQPVALFRSTRAALRGRKDILGAVRKRLLAAAPDVQVPPVQLTRIRPRTLITLIAAVFAAYLLAGQVADVSFSKLLAHANPGWMLVALGLSAATYVGAAISLSGFVLERLSLLRTFLVQVAGSFVILVTPAAVGGAALNLRYLRRAKLAAADAAASVGVTQVISFLIYVVLLLIVTAITGTSRTVSVPAWAFIALAVVVGLVLIVLALPAGRRWLLSRVATAASQVVPRLLDVAQRPVKLAQGIGGALLLTAAYILCLAASVKALGATVPPLASVAVVFLTGSAVGSLVPTPGGLGAIEAALSTGLIAAGVPGAKAVTAVLLFRMVTFWLPVPAGWLAMHYLQRRDLL